ncbi:hypothetical protein ACGFI9_04385 [Micromonospora sp. NPDC048930]|uniref:hypothetical protein n=1 Tax=Micromonospora sp. NPDC048930 TaxID=3364261 RepID=UPI00371CB87F
MTPHLPDTSTARPGHGFVYRRDDPGRYRTSNRDHAFRGPDDAPVNRSSYCTEGTS